ncbi:MAG: hypothetical protein ACC645_28865 [Pirellulales bacterium]
MTSLQPPKNVFATVTLSGYGSSSPVLTAGQAFSAAGLLVAAAGLLRAFDVLDWSHQAPLLMLIPIG